MKNKYHIGICLSYPFFCLAMMFFSYDGAIAQTIEQKIEEYIQQDLFDNSQNQMIWNLANSFLYDTDYEGKLSINKPFKVGSLNIYTLKSDPKSYFKPAECSCASLPEKAIVICDSKVFELFRYFVSDLNDFAIITYVDIGERVDSTLFEEQVKSSEMIIKMKHYHFVLRWLIGHEIGHIILNKELRLKNREEAEKMVDRFAIMGINKIADQQLSYITISELLTTMYLRNLEFYGISPNFIARDTFPKINLPLNNKKHPPWLIRFLDMAFTLIEYYPTVFDNTTYFEKIDQSIIRDTTQNEEIKLNALCENIPSEGNALADFTSTENFFPFTYYSFGTIFFEFGQYEKAINAYQQTLEQLLKEEKELFEDQDMIQRLFTGFYEKAICNYKVGNFQKSVEDLILLNQFYPNDETILNFIGLTYYELDSIELAKQVFLKCLKINNLHAESWAALGVLTYLENKYDEARLFFQMALLINPNLSNIELFKYELHWSERLCQTLLNIREKEDAFKEIIPPDSLSELAKQWAFLGNEYYRLGNFNKALFFMNKITEITEELSKIDSSNFYWQYGANINFLAMIHRAAGNFDIALTQYHKALHVRIKLAQDSSINNLFFLGQTYNNLSNYYFRSTLDEDSVAYYTDLTFKTYTPILEHASNYQFKEISKTYVNIGDYFLHKHMYGTAFFRYKIWHSLLEKRATKNSNIEFFKQYFGAIEYAFQMFATKNETSENSLLFSQLEMYADSLLSKSDIWENELLKDHAESLRENISYWKKYYSSHSFRSIEKGRSLIELYNQQIKWFEYNELNVPDSIGNILLDIIDIYNKVIEEDKNPIYLFELSRIYEIRLSFEQSHQQKIDLLKNIIALLKQVHTAFPDLTSAKDALVNAHRQLSWQYLLTRKDSLAMHHASIGSQIDPNNDLIPIYLAHSFLFNDKIDSAFTIYKNINELDSSDISYSQIILNDFITLSESRGINKQLQQSWNIITNAPLKDYMDIKYGELLAEITPLNDLITSIEKEKEIIPIEETILEICKKYNISFPQNRSIKKLLAITYGNLSWYYLFSHQFEKAEIHAMKGLELESSEIWIYTNLAHSYLLQGKYDEAENIFNTYKDLLLNTEETFGQIALKDLINLKSEGILKDDDFIRSINWLSKN